MKRYQISAFLVLSLALLGFALGIYLAYDSNPLAKYILGASARLAETSTFLFNLSKTRSKST